MWLSYNKKLKQHSRDLRNNSTLAEVMLWKQLRACNMCGYQFNRQKPIGNFIVDFYCKPLKLVIEIDGGSHFLGAVPEKDTIKQNYLESQGLKVVRFTEKQVRFKLPEVCRMLESLITDLEIELGTVPKKTA